MKHVSSFIEKKLVVLSFHNFILNCIFPSTLFVLARIQFFKPLWPQTRTLTLLYLPKPKSSNIYFKGFSRFYSENQSPFTNSGVLVCDFLYAGNQDIFKQAQQKIDDMSLSAIGSLNFNLHNVHTGNIMCKTEGKTLSWIFIERDKKI